MVKDLVSQDGAGTERVRLRKGTPPRRLPFINTRSCDYRMVPRITSMRIRTSLCLAKARFEIDRMEEISLSSLTFFRFLKPWNL